jgi:hypothetical protein
MEKIIVDIPKSQFMALEANVERVNEKLERLLNSSQEKDVYTPGEFCEVFSISMSTFHRFKKAGKFLFNNSGRKIFIGKSEVDRIKANGF